MKEVPGWVTNLAAAGAAVMREEQVRADGRECAVRFLGSCKINSFWEKKM